MCLALRRENYKLIDCIKRLQSEYAEIDVSKSLSFMTTMIPSSSLDRLHLERTTLQSQLAESDHRCVSTTQEFHTKWQLMQRTLEVLFHVTIEFKSEDITIVKACCAHNSQRWIRFNLIDGKQLVPLSTSSEEIQRLADYYFTRQGHPLEFMYNFLR